MEKGMQVKDITSAQENVTGLFAVRQALLKTASNGPYWDLRLADASGEIAAKIWSPLCNEFVEFESKSVLFVQTAEVNISKVRLEDINLIS